MGKSFLQGSMQPQKSVSNKNEYRFFRVVSNDDLGPRKKSHMQRCMIAKNYQNDALRCIVYGLRADHVDKECQSVCDQILASYADLNNDMAACEADKKN